jgi:EAL domain-containing protein (putative c-di-GMP-specific phosphodiesterase class I)
VPDVASTAAARDVGQALLGAVRDDITVGGVNLRARASIGVATGRGTPWSTLARHADVAMYEAKRAGGDAVEVHTEAHERVVSAYRLGHELDRAIGADELEIWYQPIHDLRAGRMAGLEALVRWRHPRHGLLAPDAFLGIAESSGMTARIDAWVLQRAIEQVGRWNRAGLWPAGARLHVNLSPRRLPEAQIVEVVEAELRAGNLPPGRLVLELTETAELVSPTITRILGALHELGVELALDDFGSRYAVLASLAALPFGMVKLDRSLLAPPFDRPRERLLEGIVRLAAGMDVTAVAEGIETSEQLDLVRRFDCPMGQGFLLGRPAARRETEETLPLASSQGRTAPAAVLSFRGAG